MFKDDPKVFAVVGETDSWSVDLKSADNSLDGRLRSLRRDYNPNAWRMSFSKETRRPSTTPLYAEFGIDVVHADVSGHFFGITSTAAQAVAAASSYAVYPGWASGSHGASGSGSLYSNGVGVTTGNTVGFTQGDRVGIMLYKREAQCYVRFLKNGRRNLLGYSEDMTNAAWQKLNSAVATTNTFTLTNTVSYLQQNLGAVGTVGTQVVFSAVISASVATQLYITLVDANDGTPGYNTIVNVTTTPQRFTVSATMGAGYSGSLALQLASGGIGTAGAVIKFEQTHINAGLVADPYQPTYEGPGGFMGNPIAITDTDYHLVNSSYYETTQYTFHPDQDDFLYPQTDCQAWGAAARVADTGGYSPEATKFTTIGVLATVDAFGRTLTSSSTIDMSTADNAPDNSETPGFVYYEEEVIVGGTYGGLVGLAIRNHPTGFSFPGHSASSWGYYGASGQAYHAGGSGAYGNTFGTGDIIGVIWQPTTGKLWFSKNGTVQNGGHPPSGSGAIYSNVVGDLVPAVSVYGGRHRLRTNEREMKYKPSYARALDGSDIIAHSFFNGALKTPITFEQSLWFPAVWGRGNKSSSPLGAVEIYNAGGAYDYMIDADLLRDQNITVYEMFEQNGPRFRNGLATVETVQSNGEASVRVLSRTLKSVFDVRLDYQQFALGGTVRYLPLLPRDNGTGLEYDLTHSDWTYIETVYDGGVEVTDWKRLPAVAGKGAGVRRTVNPAKKQTASVSVVTPYAKIALTNESMTWAGAVLTGWTISTSGGTVTSLSSGTATRLFGNGGAGSARISQLVSGVMEINRLYFLKLDITHYSGSTSDLEIYLESDTFGVLDSYRVRVGSTGTYYAFIGLGQGPNETVHISVPAAITDIGINNVELWSVASDDITLLFGGLAGLPSTHYPTTIPMAPFSFPIPLAYYSDKRPLIREVIDDALGQSLVDWYYTLDGVVKLVNLMPPEDVNDFNGNYRGTITEDMLAGPISVEDELAPALSDRGSMSNTYTVHSDTDIVGSITASERNGLMKPFLDHKFNLSLSNDSNDPRDFHDFYKAARGAPPMYSFTGTFYLDDPNFPTADNRLKLAHRIYAKKRKKYKVPMKRREFLDMQIELGCLVSVQSRRHNLAYGKRVQVVSIISELGGTRVNLIVRG
jgi:hypothetical protein